MISKDGDRDFHSCYVRSEAFEGLQDSQEFSFIDIVVAFGWGEGAGVVSDWAEHGLKCLRVEFSLLQEYGAHALYRLSQSGFPGGKRTADGME